MLKERQSLSVIIGTRNRPDSLRLCLESLCNQTRRPEEVLLIDDGDLQPGSYLAMLRNCRIEGRYFNKSADPGLTKSRNCGIRLAQGSILLFIDDDVVLLPQYVESIMSIYEDDISVGGVGGRLLGSDLGFLKSAFLRLFLLDSRREGAILPNGVGVLVRSISNVTAVQWFSGCNMSFRREVFEKFMFDESFTGNGWGDDRDFSYRVARKFRLVASPEATLVHREDPAGRADPQSFGEIEIVFVHRFFTKHMPRRPVNLLALWWSFLGITLKNLGLRRWPQCWGNVRGMAEVLLHGATEVRR